MVLASKQQQTILRDLLASQIPHGASTGIDGNEAYTIFSAVGDNLENIEDRQQQVFQKCKVKEKDSWGKGLHIFIPGKHKGVLDGTKN